MKLTKPQKLILYSLGQFYNSINQPWIETPLQLQTSKITFIELLLDSKIVAKQERALYRNLEALEKKKLIAYDNRMIKFTDGGLKELKKIDAEIKQFTSIEKYFSTEKIKIKRSLQTVIR